MKESVFSLQTVGHNLIKNEFLLGIFEGFAKRLVILSDIGRTPI